MRAAAGWSSLLVMAVISLATPSGAIPGPASGASGGPGAGRVAPRVKPQLMRAAARGSGGFEPNIGQAGADVKFLSRGAGPSLLLTREEAVLELAKPVGGGALSGADGAASGAAVVRMSWAQGGRPAEPVGTELLAGRTNYYSGSDESAWQTGVPHYAEVRYSSVFPGIDLDFHTSGSGLEYDLLVAPGADASAARLHLTGGSLSIDADGDLLIRTAAGLVQEHAPTVYEETAVGRRVVGGGYLLGPAGEVGFRVGAHDPGRRLIIDPVLSYATYLGGSSLDGGETIDVDVAGNAYVAGLTASADFPTKPSEGTTQQCVFANNGYANCPSQGFVSRVNRDGTLAWSTYWMRQPGVSGFVPRSLSIDQRSGDIFITGGTGPGATTTPNAFQPTITGCPPEHTCGDAYVARLDAVGGTLTYGTYLGGSDLDTGNGIAAADGLAYVTGWTYSTDFPVTPLAYQTQQNALGVCDAKGFGCGDAFMAVLDPNRQGRGQLVYSTYLGGSQGGAAGLGIAVDPSRHSVFITGHAGACGAGFTTPGAYKMHGDCLPQIPNQLPGSSAQRDIQDAFVAKLDPTAAGPLSLVYATLLGGSLLDVGLAISLDASDDAYVSGQTQSQDFPTTGAAFQRAAKAYGPGTAALGDDDFVAKLSPDGSALIYSSYLGVLYSANESLASSGTDRDSPFSDWSGLGMTTDASGMAYITGLDDAPGHLPVKDAIQPAFGGGASDAFVEKVDPSATTADGSLVYATYLGGDGADIGAGIVIDRVGSLWITGRTTSDPASFGVSPGAPQRTWVPGSCPGFGRHDPCPDAFVVKITDPHPIVLGISPRSGPTTGGTAVTICGTAFLGASAVSFGSGSPAGSFHLLDPGICQSAATAGLPGLSAIAAVSPPHASGPVHVQVATPAGLSSPSANDLFTYVPPLKSGQCPGCDQNGGAPSNDRQSQSSTTAHGGGGGSKGHAPSGGQVSPPPPLVQALPGAQPLPLGAVQPVPAPLTAPGPVPGLQPGGAPVPGLQPGVGLPGPNAGIAGVRREEVEAAPDFNMTALHDVGLDVAVPAVGVAGLVGFGGCLLRWHRRGLRDRRPARAMCRGEWWVDDAGRCSRGGE